MSNIYIQEPPTEGKVLLETTVGDIDIELWSRECPKACRNFIQLCLEGYYDKTIFHRLVKGFIVQGGDPTGTGQGGQSIWGKPFKDEFHSRLRFARRGLVAMANAGRDDNSSQFFFTLGPTPELQNKHTIFAKVGGNTIYNMIKLEEGEVDDEERPLYTHKILRTKVLNNPFDDIVPRESIKRIKEDKKSKNKSSAVKNFGLLSFGEEAEEEEEEMENLSKKFSAKGKSSHDLLTNDPKLSAQPACDPSSSKAKPMDEDGQEKSPHSSAVSSEGEHEAQDDNDNDRDKLSVDFVKDKLKRKDDKRKPELKKSGSGSGSKTKMAEADEDELEEEYYLGKDEKDAEKERLMQIRKEYKQLKRSMRPQKDDNDDEGKKDEVKLDHTAIQEYMTEKNSYKEKKTMAKKGEDREAITLALLSKFKSKITSAKEEIGEDAPPLPPLPLEPQGQGQEETEDDNFDPADNSWLARSLHSEGSVGEVLAKDANKKSDDWYEIYDPKNPLNKRRREESKRAQAERWKKSKVVD